MISRVATRPRVRALSCSYGASLPYLPSRRNQVGNALAVADGAPSHDGLNGLGQHLPAVLQIRLYPAHRSCRNLLKTGP
jgi:hypothetical protein